MAVSFAIFCLAGASFIYCTATTAAVITAQSEGIELLSVVSFRFRFHLPYSFNLRI